MVGDGREAGRHPLYIYTYSSTPSCSTGAGTFRISPPNSNTSDNQYLWYRKARGDEEKRLGLREAGFDVGKGHGSMVEHGSGALMAVRVTTG